MTRRYDWETIRAEWEAGTSPYALGEKKGNPTRQGITKRMRAEGWVRDSEVTLRNKVTEKVTGIVTAGDPKKKAIAIDAEAGRRAEVEKRHREEPNAVRERLYAGLKAHKNADLVKDDKDKLMGKKLAFEDLKAAKISSEALGNIHTLERKAWRLEDKPDEATPLIIAMDTQQYLEARKTMIEKDDC